METRIDKYLWSVRIFKTRALATEACRKGRIMINEMSVKPSRSITKGDVFTVRKMPVIYTFRVIEPIQKRVGAKMAGLYVEDLTPREELDKLKLNDIFYTRREKGSGRPTKKERRDLDRLSGK